MLCAAASAQDNIFGVYWDRNLETNVIGYRVHWGGASGHYYAVRDVFNETNTMMPASLPIYVAVTAYDAEGLESGYSSEIFRQTNSGIMAIKLSTPRFAEMTNTVQVPAGTNPVWGIHFTIEAVAMNSGTVVARAEAFATLFETVGPVIFQSTGVLPNYLARPTYKKALLKMQAVAPPAPGVTLNSKSKVATVGSKKGKLEK